MIASTGPGLMTFITVFVLAAFVGYEVVSKVPSILHTPLMSGSNAIHGIILVGTMIVLGEAHGAAQLTLGFLAVVLATLNVVGGVRGDRPDASHVQAAADRPQSATGRPRRRRRATRARCRDRRGGPGDSVVSRATATDLVYLVAIVGFILALKGLSSPSTPRLGNLVGAGGMLVAVAWTFSLPGGLLPHPQPRAHHRGDRHRRRGRHPGGPSREDDRDAADGGHLQRRGRRRRGLGLGHRVHLAARHSRSPSTRSARSSSVSWSGRCPSRAAPSPSPSSRSS